MKIAIGTFGQIWLLFKRPRAKVPIAIFISTEGKCFQVHLVLLTEF